VVAGRNTAAALNGCPCASDPEIATPVRFRRFGSNTVNVLGCFDLAHPWRASATGLALVVGLAAAGYGGMAGTPGRSSSMATTVAVTTAAKVTIKSASVAGLGTVLVDGAGRTLYTLTSETKDKITCTMANGCTGFWSQIGSKSGQRHQTRGGARASMIGSEKGTPGTHVLTYHRRPLYTYVGDSASGQANGEGLKSYGGTWYAVSASGSLVKKGSSAASPSSGSGGYGY
jgi:predicted lipoprotein with Yx(FWY)xxD motif